MRTAPLILNAAFVSTSGVIRRDRSSCFAQSWHGEELTSTENRVAFARQGYNDQVTEYNTYKQTFPSVVFAGFFGHSHDGTLLEFEDSAAMQAAPEVKFT